jgi:hypothetical protein
MIYKTIEHLSSREFFVASYCSVYLFFCELRIVRSISSFFCGLRIARSICFFVSFVLFGLFPVFFCGLRIARSICFFVSFVLFGLFPVFFVGFVLLGLFAFCVVIYRSLFVFFHFSFDNFYCLSFVSFAASDYPFG